MQGVFPSPELIAEKKTVLDARYLCHIRLVLGRVWLRNAMP